jgi:integrase
MNWQKTKTQNLLRHKSSGNYYGRWKIAGKQKWKSLGTNVYSIAKLRHLDESSKIERIRSSAKSLNSGDCTMADLIQAYREQTQARTDLKESSKISRETALGKILKTWPRLPNLKPIQVTINAVNDWARRFKAKGTQFRAPGSQAIQIGNSATSVNRAIDTLRILMDLALARGAIATNPVLVKTADGERLKKKIQKTQLQLPSSEDLQRLLQAIEQNGSRGGWGQEAADFCRFLTYSGCRVGEVKTITWRDVDFGKLQLHAHGYKTESSNRIIPLFPDLEQLLKNIKARRTRAATFTTGAAEALLPASRLFHLGECQKSITSACLKIGLERITHHDFRHIFVTRCIESGVDIPTISRWVGHADGGALLMRTYGHLRTEHSQQQAMRVKF